MLRSRFDRGDGPEGFISAMQSIVRLALLIALAFICLQIAAIPRKRPAARSIELTARWSDPNEEELESVSICPNYVQPRLPPLAVARVVDDANWVPELTVELDLTACDDWPALPIGSEQTD